jgi:hypothetical protein
MGFLGNIGSLFKQFGGAVKENFLNNTAGAVWNGRQPGARPAGMTPPFLPEQNENDLWDGGQGMKAPGPKTGLIQRLYHRNKVRDRNRNYLRQAGDEIQEGMRFMGEFAQGGEIGDRQYGIVGEAGPEMVVNTGAKSQIIPIRVPMPSQSTMSARPDFRQSRRFKGLMAHGGDLLPGEFGIVGEEGPEVVANEDGRTKVIPFPDPIHGDASAEEKYGTLPNLNNEPKRIPMPDLPYHGSVGSSSGEEYSDSDDPEFGPAPPGLPYENPLKRNLRHSMNNASRLNQIDTDDELRSEYDKKKDGMLKNIGKGIALGFSRLDPNVFLNKNIGDSAALGYALGGALGGGLGGVIDPLQDERAQHARKLGIADQGVQRDQGMYKTDIENRKGEMDIKNVESVVGDRATDNARQLRELANKYEIAQGKLQTERYKDLRRGHTAALVFDPAKNPSDKAASDEYQAITGVPLAPKSAEVKSVDEFPNAANDRLFRRTTYKDGRVEAGYVKSDGTLTANEKDAAIYKAPSVAAAEAAAGARVESAKIYANVNYDQLKETIRNNDLKNDLEITSLLAGIKVAGDTGQITPEKAEELRQEVYAKYPKHKP